MNTSGSPQQLQQPQLRLPEWTLAVDAANARCVIECSHVWGTTSTGTGRGGFGQQQQPPPHQQQQQQQQQPPAVQYQRQLQSLYDMGFDDEQGNLNALVAVHGNLNRAVDMLIEAAATSTSAAPALPRVPTTTTATTTMIQNLLLQHPNPQQLPRMLRRKRRTIDESILMWLSRATTFNNNNTTTTTTTTQLGRHHTWYYVDGAFWRLSSDLIPS
jgi:hypothetical protein